MAKKTKVQLARISPSGSDRWIKCPGSLQATFGLPEQETNEYALDGTTAHKLLEVCGEFDADPFTLVGTVVPETGREITIEMAESVAKTIAWINDWCAQRPDAVLKREHKVKIPLGPYELEGTADFIAFSLRTRELLTLDYKNGAGVWVDAEENTQIALYMLGALNENLNAKKLTGVIAQPNAVRGDTAPIREWPVKMQRLRQIESEAIEALHIAHQPNAPRTAGTHCRWCGAAATCRELAEYNLRNAVKDFEDIRTRPVVDPQDPQKLTPDGLAYLLSQVYVIEGWLRAIESEAVRRLMAQKPVPGYKLTQGRSQRSWANEKRVYTLLKDFGYKEDLFAPRKLCSPAQAEKLVKTNEKVLKRVAALTVKKPGAPHVAPENDPRPALAGGAAFVFKPVPKKA